jgi:large subunit ribosomal protein L31e
MVKKAEKRTTVAEVISRETTIHLHKYVHGRQFKKRAPSAVKAIKAAALKMMGTQDVRIDPKLNKALWSKGIKNVPRRIRFARKRNDDEEAKHKLYTVVSYVPVAHFGGSQTETIDE